MFRLFKSKSKRDKLQVQYKNLLKEAYVLSTTNRKLSDEKILEADKIMKEIERSL